MFLLAIYFPNHYNLLQMNIAILEVALQNLAHKMPLDFLRYFSKVALSRGSKDLFYLELLEIFSLVLLSPKRSRH
jgi:hypothetical protein